MSQYPILPQKINQPPHLAELKRVVDRTRRVGLTPNAAADIQRRLDGVLDHLDDISELFRVFGCTSYADPELELLLRFFNQVYAQPLIPASPITVPRVRDGMIHVERHEAVGYQQWPGPPPRPKRSSAPRKSEAPAPVETGISLGRDVPSLGRNLRQAQKNFLRRRGNAPGRSRLLARLADEFLAESKRLAETENIEIAAEYWAAAAYPPPRPPRPRRRRRHDAGPRGPPVPESRAKKWPGF